jgi:hypothetical protein
LTEPRLLAIVRHFGRTEGVIRAGVLHDLQVKDPDARTGSFNLGQSGDELWAVGW